jgi:glycosyltransferase involved in cell wall biosynthesis
MNTNGQNFEGLSIVIPAFNEEQGIGVTLTNLVRLVPGAEIIVVDDSSTDGTADIVSHNHPEVILVQHLFNRGYGAALKSGMSVASRDYVAWFDADNEHKAEHLIEMYELIRNHKLAAVIGQRKIPGVTVVRKWGKFIIRMLAKSLKYEGGPDMNCGLRVFRREVISQYLPLLPNGFSASMTSTLLMLERGYPTQFHLIDINPRLGSSKVRLSDGFMSLVLVIRIVMLVAPLRIFLRLGLLFLLFGSVYGSVLALLSKQGFPVLAVVMILIGIVLSVLGLIADQISQMRLSQFYNSYNTVIKNRMPVQD